MNVIHPFTFSSRDGSRTDTTTGYVDYLEGKRGPGVLLSLFGYNSGAQQWLHLFDVGTGAPTLAISSASGGDSWFEAVGHGVLTGDKLVITNIAGIASNRFWFAGRIDANLFSIHPTLADALANINGQTPSSASDPGTATHVPFHTFAIAATDNFSVIVPVTGIGFGKGLVAANSTTGPLYTAGAKNVTMCGTLKS